MLQLSWALNWAWALQQAKGGLEFVAGVENGYPYYSYYNRGCMHYLHQHYINGEP